MKTHIVDTNVLLVANRQHTAVSDECVTACTQRLADIMDSGRIAIDDGHRIIDEYTHMTTPWRGKRAGDVFFKWLLQNQGNPERCDRVAIEEHPGLGFSNFPTREDLATFDVSDRKFVAVALAHESHPSILQAADSKWLGWAAGLHASGVSVEFLCPDDIKRFADAKKKTKARRD